MKCRVVIARSIPPDVAHDLRTIFLAVTHKVTLDDEAAVFDPRHPDLILAGCFQGSTHGLELARRVRAVNPRVPIVLVTDSGSEALAVASLRLRLNDYFAAPFDWGLIRISLEQFLPHDAGPDDAVEPLADGNQLAGKSAFLRGLRRQIARISPSPSNVLITGETGTGKEVVARLIHSNSSRAQGPFVCINCAAIPESLLESELFGYERGAFTGAVAAHEGLLRQAVHGTVLLDEIGELSLGSQIKLLRVIETRQMYPLGSRHASVVDARFVAATNQPLEDLIEEKKFRKDLYFRLNVSRIEVAPLRERPEDLLPLIERFVAEFNRTFGREIESMTPEATDILLGHTWPGNVRELRNVIESMFVVAAGSRLSTEDMPQYLLRASEHNLAAEASEREMLLSALNSSNWNKSEAARLLQWSRMTVYRKIVKYQLEDVTVKS